jgi:hypothetical protein
LHANLLFDLIVIFLASEENMKKLFLFMILFCGVAQVDCLLLGAIMGATPGLTALAAGAPFFGALPGLVIGIVYGALLPINQESDVFSAVPSTYTAA